MLSVGLTGGIGSGKSSVSARLSTLGALVIDSDLIAREIVEPGEPALAEVEVRFGPGVIRADRTLDRQALADIVFHDPAALAALNDIMLPRIGARTSAIEAAAPHDAVVVHDSPLLVEQGLAAVYDVVVVVDCPDEVRLERLVEQRRMSATDARARMAAQATRDERLAVADFVLDNSGSLADLHAQVDQLWAHLLAAAGSTTVEG